MVTPCPTFEAAHFLLLEADLEGIEVVDVQDVLQIMDGIRGMSMSTVGHSDCEVNSMNFSIRQLVLLI